MDTSRFDEAVALFSEICFELLSQKEDFVDVEDASFRLALDVLRQGLGAALTRFDDKLYQSGDVSGSVKSREKRTVIGLCGEVSFHRRRYETEDSSYLPLDEILALAPRSRLSPAATYEIVMTALDQSYQKTADAFERISSVRITKPTVGEAIVRTANYLGCDCEGVGAKKALRTLMCEADGVWVALQHNKAARLKAAREGVHLPRKKEVCLAVDYEGKKGGKRINPQYTVSLDGHEVFWQQVVASQEQRLETELILSTLLGTDGESGYVQGRDWMPGKVTHIYDRWHVFRAVRNFVGADISPEIIALINARRLDGALLHLGGYRDAFRQDREHKRAKDIQKCMKFLIRWQEEILAGLTHSLGTCEGSISHVLAARLNTLGRSWSERRMGAIALLRAHTHSGYSVPKIRRKTPRLPPPLPPPKLPKKDKWPESATKFNSKQSEDHYYNQVTFTPDRVASHYRSWQDEYWFI